MPKGYPGRAGRISQDVFVLRRGGAEVVFVPHYGMVGANKRWVGPGFGTNTHRAYTAAELTAIGAVVASERLWSRPDALADEVFDEDGL